VIQWQARKAKDGKTKQNKTNKQTKIPPTEPRRGKDRCFPTDFTEVWYSLNFETIHFSYFKPTILVFGHQNLRKLMNT
jgi:hypothetical protein